MLKIKRAYDAYSRSDGFRVLIDRLWPRGVSKTEAHIDLWLKEISPSLNLRKWFNHDPLKWQEFQKKYEKELDENQELVKQIKALEKKHGTVTLIYSAKDDEHNNAVALLNYLQK